jgi:hypothetical protein
MKTAQVILSLAVTLSSIAMAGPAGAIYTTNKGATIVDGNVQYAFATDVYISGGPQNLKDPGLTDGTYYFQVTDPSGSTLLSTDNAVCRQLMVVGGRVTGSTGPACKHANGTFNPANGVTPVQLFPFSQTPNNGGEYKAWAVPTTAATISASDPKVLIFSNSDSKTDNYKVPPSTTPPAGSCAAASSLSVLVSGTNVTSYVPKGNWTVTPAKGVSVVNVEGSGVTPTLIPTANTVNSCASNSLTGKTVCTANNTDVYLLTGTALASTLTSGGSGSIYFGCTNCGVAMDATHNKAVIGLSIGSKAGFQFLDLAGAPAFEPAFTSPAGFISEESLIDPIRNLLLSASEIGDFEIVNVATSTAPAFFENAVGGYLDSTGEDCSTGIALAPRELVPSAGTSLYIADLTQAVLTPGSPGTWTDAGSQNQVLSESILSSGAGGVAVAQGTHTGIVSGEFGGNAITALALPSTSGSGIPAITDWVSCNIPGFSMGFDPHTLTAYQSPNSGDAIAVLANGGASSLAVVDLTKMLNTAIVPRTAVGHGCASGTLPATVVSFVAVP